MPKYDFIETDKRILDLRLRRHQISPSEYQKIQKGLPDDKEQSEECNILTESTDSPQK